MKKVYAVLIALFLSLTGYSQSCLPEGIEFSTQAQIDSFQVNYPNCTQIEGNVTIYTSEWGDITNLSGLSVLTSIGGNLEIINYDFGTSSNLYSLAGLEGITAIGGDLIICNNSALTNLSGLDNLISIGGNLNIGNEEYWGNINLSSLTGLESLAEIGGDLYISNNDILATLTGLENLTTIGGSLEIGGNPALTNLVSLGNLSELGWNLYINSNNSLTSLTGLENITAIDGYLSISGNGSLNTLTGLDNLASIGYNIYIAYNPSLTSLTGLDNISPSTIIDLSIFQNELLSDCSVQSICDYLANPNGSVHINNNASGCENPPEVADDCGISPPCLPYGNYYFTSQAEIDNFQTDYPECTDLQGFVSISGDNITNLSGLNNITSFGNVLWIVDNPLLTSLAGLEQVSSIGSHFLIQGNENLSSLSGLESLASIGGRFQINYNDSLTDLTGLNALDSIGNDFEIRNNGALNNLTALSNLIHIEGELYICYNYSLNNLAGLEGISSVGEHLTINSNPHLITFSGLDNLTSIGGVLFINGNNYLTDINAIKNIDATSITDLYIYFNSSLSICNVKSICDYLVSPNGTVDIHNNAVGCDSQSEVEIACGVGIIDNSTPQFQITISPNPASTAITISLPTATPSNNTILSIYNVNAQQVISHRLTEPITVLDIGTLPSGVYFARVTNDRTVIVSKFVKQ